MPSENIATIDPAEIFITFGPKRLTGFAEGTYFTATKVNDDFTYIEGSDGEGVFVRNPSNAWNITVVLQQSSKSNEVLSVARELDRNTPGGVLSTMKASHRGTSLNSAKCRIIRPPDITFANGVESRTWSMIATFFEGPITGMQS